MATMELLSQGDYFIGAFSSNLARIVYELMSRRVWPPPMLETDNDVWFLGGAGVQSTICTQYTCKKHGVEYPYDSPECMGNMYGILDRFAGGDGDGDGDEDEDEDDDDAQ